MVLALIVSTLFFLPPITFAQSTELEGYGLHDKNEVITSFSNFGTISSPGGINDLVWPKESNIGYAWEMDFFIAATVIDVNGAMRHIVSERAADGGDQSPQGDPWGWEPLAGFVNLDNAYIAMSDAPSSWPADWTEWNSIHSNGEIVADQESFYVISESVNQEFEYYPVPSDSSVRGLGLQVEVRGFQWDNREYKDFLLVNYKITNVSDKTLDSIIAGIYGDPHIGGRNDYTDDYTAFVDSTGIDSYTGNTTDVRNVLYSWDADTLGDAGAVPGVFGLGFMNNSSGIKMGSAKNLSYGSRVLPGQDDSFWNILTSEGTYSMNQVTDNIIYVGTTPFSLEPGQFANVGVVFVFGKNKPALFRHMNNAQIAYAQIEQVDTLNIALTTYPSDEVSGTQSLEWSCESDALVDLFYTLNRGEEWQLLSANQPASGSFDWNTSEVPDGFNGQVEVVARNSETIGRSTSPYFIINNPGNTDVTDLILQSPLHADTLEGNVSIQWRAGDADGDPVQVSVLLSDDSEMSWETIATVEDGEGYIWDTSNYPNGIGYSLKLRATNSVSQSESDVIGPFVIQNTYPMLPDSSIIHSSGRADGLIQVQVVDSSATTGHTYRVSFDDSTATQMTYDVFDVDDNQFVLENVAQLTSETSGPEFDGLRLLLQNVNMGEYDTSQTGWVAGASNLMYEIELYDNNPVQPPIDYQIEFSDNADNEDYFQNSVNCSVKNLIDSSDEDFIFHDLDDNHLVSGNDHLIILHFPENSSTPRGVWDVHFENPVAADTILPGTGDVFEIIPRNRFSSEDGYYFHSPAPTKIENELSLPHQFELYQNYPNPFNPTTTINYNLPGNSDVELTVFNLKGQLVKTLIHQNQEQGYYHVQWNGTNSANILVASGVYFYRLQTTFGVKLNKMILLR